ncbi:DUF3263 domain-containing protein [Streptomyces sp. NPDC059092]|uniref:DUF3263 domain-containing protein n=1 Tax=Streptomyces sp. NPDC059092 TaxID=3346725 RepID=UPI00368C4A48
MTTPHSAPDPDPDPEAASDPGAAPAPEAAPDPDPEAAPERDQEAAPAPGTVPDPDPEAAPDAAPAPALSARDRAVLAMEGRGWPGPGAKEREIRERLGLSPTRYYQLLNALLDDPRAAEHDPVTVNRLRRVRAARRDLR